MTSTRTQIYLTEAQRRRLDEICTTRGVSLAEAVREAVDCWLEMRRGSCSEALAATWGKAPQAEVPPRDEWDRPRTGTAANSGVRSGGGAGPDAGARSETGGAA